MDAREKSQEKFAKQVWYNRLMTFVKGKSGNPKGLRPGHISLLAIMREELQKIPEGERENYARKGIREYVKQFATGKESIVQDGLDRTDGKATQPLSGPNGGDIPLGIRVKYE